MYIRFCGFMDDCKICTSDTVDIQNLPTEIQRTSSNQPLLTAYLGNKQSLLSQSHDFSVAAICSTLRRDDDDGGIIHKICCLTVHCSFLTILLSGFLSILPL